MSRRDVINYYIGVQEQYLEMRRDVKDLEDAVKTGHISQEQFESNLEAIEKLKENYNRISVIINLLNEPNRDSKKDKYRKQNNLTYDYLKNSDELYIKSENEDVLKKLKELIKEAKDNKEKNNG